MDGDTPSAGAPRRAYQPAAPPVASVSPKVKKSTVLRRSNQRREVSVVGATGGVASLGRAEVRTHDGSRVISVLAWSEVRDPSINVSSPTGDVCCCGSAPDPRDAVRLEPPSAVPGPSSSTSTEDVRPCAMRMARSAWRRAAGGAISASAAASCPTSS